LLDYTCERIAHRVYRRTGQEHHTFDHIQCGVKTVIRPSDDSVIYLYRHPVDMHKAINGLVAIVEGEMGLDPFSSTLFVFRNTARTIIKLVGWEGNRFILWMKRIEKARFRWPVDCKRHKSAYAVSAALLALTL
jgi:transposase